jgi:hypothetical protein
MVVMVLCLLDVYRSQIDRMAEPQLVQKNGEKPSPESSRPTWGVIHRAPLPGDPMPSGPVVPIGSQLPPQKRSPWGAINRPTEW